MSAKRKRARKARQRSRHDTRRMGTRKSGDPANARGGLRPEWESEAVAHYESGDQEKLALSGDSAQVASLLMRGLVVHDQEQDDVPLGMWLVMFAIDYAWGIEGATREQLHAAVDGLCDGLEAEGSIASMN